MSAPLSVAAEGTLLDLEVVPGAQEDRFPAGYNPWRERVQVRVAAPAQNGRANQALCNLVADHFSLPPERVRLVKGATSRRKTVLLAGLSTDQVARGLAEVLP